ncbi:hypothetical protein GJ629_02060 [Halapricum sp. CBA1109]|uniref:STT3 domain-containing protein n=1 Tax=Halapricum sp. CBA1109 TaxID=2668068 RepID=UPI0012F713C4|nr:STT3 domain-containing protein [Halapricum sp. CBA1109]MUV88823.1 hypothetical protein [Halapricum sp. CBA1109]
MTDVAEATASLVADRPDVAADLETLLDIDADGTWTFEDIPMDSGTFGEIVSRGIAAEVDDGYRITDREAVRRGLEGDETSAGEDDETADNTSGVVHAARERMLSRSVAAVAGVLVFVALIRIGVIQGSVLRNGEIVLAGNDAYAYWRQVSRIVASDVGLLDLSNLPSRSADGDVLFVVGIWWVVALTGTSVATVLAWYPVIAGVAGTGLLYLVVRSLTDDRRIALASAVMLGITPVHAFRTALGFGDHDALDLLWLTAVVLALVVLAYQRREEAWRRTTGAAVVTLGVAVAAQMLSWRGGALYLLPVGLTVVAVVLDDIRAGRAPLRANGPLLAGLGLGAVLGLLPHLAFGWLPAYRAAIPGLLFGGAAAVVGVASVVDRLGYGVRATAVVEGVVGIASVAVVASLLSGPVEDFLAYMATTGERNIAETGSLIGGDVGSIGGPIFLFGLLLFLAVPYLVIVSLRAYRQSAPAWLVPAAFAWYFLLASVVQQRFAVALSPFVAIFAGVGFVHLANWVDLARPVGILDGKRDIAVSLPDRRQIGLVVILFLLVGSLSFVQVPVKMQQVAVDDAAYETGAWIAENASEQGLEHPNDTIATDWDRVRMYNYLAGSVDGPDNFAQATFGRFAEGTNTTRWYGRLETGYVVLERTDRNASAGSVFDQLAAPIARPAALSASHFRLVYARPDDHIAVYRLLPGARIEGTGPVNSTVDVRANVTVSGSGYQYEQTVETDRNGTYRAVVPYPGEYRIGNRTVTVPGSAVRTGGTVSDTERP